MRTIIAGDRDIDDYKYVCKAIKESGFKITEVVSGGAKGVDTLGEQWATDNGIPFKQFKPLWDALNAPDAVIKTNSWGKKYDAKAGTRRNGDMAKYAAEDNGGQLIAIQRYVESAGTQDMIKQAEALNLKVFVYMEKKKDSDYVYNF